MRRKIIPLPSPSPDCYPLQQTPVEHVPFASQRSLAGSWILLSFTFLQPHPRDSKVTRVRLEGRAQLSRSHRAIIQEEVRKDPSDMQDFLAGVRSLTSSA